MKYLFAILLALTGCRGCGSDGDDSVPIVEGLCGEVSESLGKLVCVHAIADQRTWELVTVEAAPVDQLRATKFLIPRDESQPLPLLFLNSNVYTLHYDMLLEAFPDHYAGLSHAAYVDLILNPDHPAYYAGNLAEYIATEGGTFFGFTVWDDPADVSATATYEEVLEVYNQLRGAFTYGELVFVPSSANQVAAVAGWNAAFPIRGVDSTVDYEPYTVAVGYGTLRFYTLPELEDATAEAAFGFQDILVLDDAPLDVERIVSGAVTGTRQAALSHLNVRSAARGTPNCYISDPFHALAQWEGQLVRLECGERDWSVSPASIDEATAWWEALRPDPVSVPAADLDHADFGELLQMPTSTAADRALNLRRYGAKGSNLATLYQRTPSELQLPGFLIPFRYYDAFMHSGAWLVDLGQGEAEYTFAETLELWLQDPAFLSDAAYRRERLDALRSAMRDAPVDPALVQAVYDEIVATWGDDRQSVRFRSSSNAEDALEFSGAGLYDSTTVCAADELDGDTVGPSLCDPDEPDERTISRGLQKVWASLWKMTAYEERAWYGIDQSEVVMGVLVNTRSKDELANMVAFTGNPSTNDDRYLVNSQVGDLAVVGAPAGVFPESVLLELNDAGEVTDILRVSGSSELPAGEDVLSDAQLRALGEAFFDIRAVFPIDSVAPEGAEILLDTEWKVLSDGQLIVKQVRPFLRDE